MKCTHCIFNETRVIDSRLSKDGLVIRRRRECPECHVRFTTYEKIEENFPLVVKSDNRREQFNRNKVLDGIQKACQKRPVDVDTIESVVDKLERVLLEMVDKEVSSKDIGRIVLKKLQTIDQVAYVRFASVYRSFNDVNEFIDEIKMLLNSDD